MFAFTCRSQPASAGEESAFSRKQETKADFSLRLIDNMHKPGAALDPESVSPNSLLHSSQCCRTSSMILWYSGSLGSGKQVNLVVGLLPKHLANDKDQRPKTKDLRPACKIDL